MTPLLSASTLGDAKMSKKGTRFVEFNFLTNSDRRKRFGRTKEEWQIYKIIQLIFAPGLSYDLSKFSDDFTPFFFSTLKDLN